jgi:hypothetical protein
MLLLMPPFHRTHHPAPPCFSCGAQGCEERADALMEADPGALTNFSWLNQALAQLFLARKVMAYSYIFAYYMFGQVGRGGCSTAGAGLGSVACRFAGLPAW